MRALVKLLPLLLGEFTTTKATTYVVQAFYSGSACDGTPYLVNANEDPDCAGDLCTATGVAVGTISTECTTDYLSALRGKFGNSPYVLEVFSHDSDCATFGSASSFLASGNCEGSFNVNESMGVHFLATFEANGSASVKYYSGSSCVNEQWITTERVDKHTLATHSCDSRGYTWYSSNDILSSSRRLGIAGIIGVSVASLIVISLVVKCAHSRQRSKKRQTQSSIPLTTAILQSDETVHPELVASGPSALWHDEVIVASRVPRYKIKLKKIISRGAHGEVYQAKFNRKLVAVKILVPATRGSIQQVNDLLVEAKMTATMDHPHIVAFIGVAWDSLSDLCVVLELMDGGDLRSLLNKYEKSGYSVGINRQKATIALHICHALTYLHSLSPPVVHRPQVEKYPAGSSYEREVDGLWDLEGAR